MELEIQNKKINFQVFIYLLFNLFFNLAGSKQFEIRANRIGISIIDHILNNGIHRELIFMQFEKLFLLFYDTGNSIQVKAKLFDLQVI